MLKKTLIGIMLLLMAVTVQVTLPGCASSAGPSGTTAPVNTPTNKYLVKVMVLNIGGLPGCCVGRVWKDADDDGAFSDDEVVRDARVTINGSALDSTNEGYGRELTVEEGRPLSLAVVHQGDTVASGTVAMPSPVIITAPANQGTHGVNTPLTLAWKPVEYATTIQATVRFFDTAAYLDTAVYRTPTLEPTATSCVVPASAFAGAGIYVVELAAVNGIPSGIAEIDSVGKGYNLAGAAGYFIAATNAFDTLFVK